MYVSLLVYCRVRGSKKCRTTAAAGPRLTFLAYLSYPSCLPTFWIVLRIRCVPSAVPIFYRLFIRHIRSVVHLLSIPDFSFLVCIVSLQLCIYLFIYLTHPMYHLTYSIRPAYHIYLSYLADLMYPSTLSTLCIVLIPKYSDRLRIGPVLRVGSCWQVEADGASVRSGVFKCSCRCPRLGHQIHG